MDIKAYDNNGNEFAAAPAGFKSAGEDVFDVLDADGNFMDSITVSPLADTHTVLTAWVGSW